MYNTHIIFGFEKSGRKVGGIFVGQEAAIGAYECIIKENDIVHIRWLSGDCYALCIIEDSTIDELSCIIPSNKIYRVYTSPTSLMEDMTVEEIKEPDFIICIGANLQFITVKSIIGESGACMELLISAENAMEASSTCEVIRDNIIRRELWIPTKHLHISRGYNDYKYGKYTCI